MLKTIAYALMLSLVGCTANAPPADKSSSTSSGRMNTLAVPSDSFQGVSAAQPALFQVVEAPAGELNADTLGAEANVQVSYPSLAVKDTVGIRLTGVALRDAPIQAVSTVGVLTFKLSKAWITENKGRTVTLTYTYRVGGVGSLITSAPLSIRVVGAQGQSVFKVVEAPAGELNADTLGAEANVQVSYPRLAVKDTVGIRLTGVALRDAPIQAVSTVGVQTFKLPKAWLVENKGRTVSLTYTYKVGGAGSLITSAPLSIRVVGAQGQSVFKVVEAPAGELNADTLGAEANVQVSYPSLAVKDTVGIRLTGVALRDAPIQTVSTLGVQTFKLPKAWLVENKGRTVSLTYTYKVAGVGNLITSSPLPIKVTGVAAPGDGQRVANELNAQYSTVSNTCPNSPNQGAWYCSGVLIRTVDDSTSFRAWNPSPGAVKLGAVSYSYMKTGIGMNQLQGSRTQGFVLETGQNFTANGGYPLRVLCSYPYDAGTLIRGAAGCGAASNFPSNSGPCAAQGLTTLAGWRAHFQQYPANSTNRYHHQCSFGVDKAGFELSLLSRENPAGELAAWRQNEVMIQTWPQNTSNLPIKAFIYFNTASRAVGVEGAKNIQRDFLKSTGRRIPVIKVSPNAATIFSYSAGDQGI